VIHPGLREVPLVREWHAEPGADSAIVTVGVVRNEHIGRALSAI